MKLHMNIASLLGLLECVQSSPWERSLIKKNTPRKGSRHKLRRDLKTKNKGKKNAVAEVHANLIDNSHLPVIVDAWMYSDGQVEGSLYTEDCRPSRCLESPSPCLAAAEWTEGCVYHAPTSDTDEVQCGEQCPTGWYDPSQYDQTIFGAISKEVEIDCLNFGQKESCVRHPYDWAIVSGKVVSGGTDYLNDGENMYVHYAFRQGQDFGYDNGVASVSLSCHFITYIECNCVASQVRENFPWNEFPEPNAGQCKPAGHPGSCGSAEDTECQVVCQDQSPCGASATPLCEALTIEYVEGGNVLGVDLFEYGAPTDPGTRVEVIIH